jgi:hypothetical protein
MRQGWVRRALLVAAMVLATTSAFAQSQWVLAPSPPKAALPKHLSGLSGLPDGSVYALQRREGKAGARWELTLPDGATVRVEPGSIVSHPNGDRSYAGTVVEHGAAYPVFVTEGRDASFGTWVTPRGRFRFESWRDRAWLVDLDHPQVSEPPNDDDAVPARARGALDAGEPGNPFDAFDSSRPDVGKAAPGTQIDVLFLHSAGFAQRYPGSASETRVRHLVALANQIFANSAVDLGLRVVGIEATSYTDAGTNGAALAAMRDALEASGPPAAGLAGLRARRDALGADLVTLVRPHDIETRDSCGIAYLFGSGAGHGVNVLSDGTSSWSICGDEVYAHEVGHNLGAEHQAGASSEAAGYGQAHVALGQYHTVMGSFGTGRLQRGLRLYRFSNPQQLCGGRPCGVPGVSDNARRLRASMNALAAFRAPRSSAVAVVVPAPLDPDDDGDGVPESRDAFPYEPAHHADGDGDGVADGLDAFPNNPSESADLDGDGIGDNADPDLDGDGSVNGLDALPRERSEVSDLDNDGVGDNADAFDTDPRESGDLDRDGLGDNADADTDGDGAADYDPAAQDLLVSSLGADRVLRLDGESGGFVAIEIAESHAPLALGPKSALAWNPYRRRVDALIASEVRRYDPALRQRESRVLRGYRSEAAPGLKSGLSVAMAAGSLGEIFIADGGVLSELSLHRYDPVSARETERGLFSDAAFFAASPRALSATTHGSVWTLDRLGNLSEVSSSDGGLMRSVVLGAGFDLDATALAQGPDGALYVADAKAHRVLRVDPGTGATTNHVASGSGGLDRPAGLAFDRAGQLYVSSAGTHQVLRYHANGAFRDVFAKAPAGLMSSPQALLFVPRIVDRYARDAQRRFRPRVGAWRDPQRSGQGLDVQAISGGLAVGWYTYDAQGRATWYLGVGALQGERWSAPLQRYVWDGTRAIGSAVGMIELEFSAEHQARFRWTLDGRGGEATVEQFAVGNSLEAQFPTADWYDPARSGWGYSVTRLGDVLAVAAFFFDRNGQPTWALGAGEASASEFAILRYADADGCPGCSGEAPATSRVIGSVRFEVLDDTRARGGIQAQGEDIDWRFEALDLRRLSDTPTRPNGDPLP